jgi:single-strand DNA-binding protein
MLSFNRVHIIGYQTQPVTVRQTPQGTSVTDLNLIVPYRFRAEDGSFLDGKGFHVVTLWGPMAEIAGKFVRPGSQVFISGRLQTDSWESDSGEKRSKTKVVALDLILLDPKDGQMDAPEGSKSLTNVLNRADIVGNVTRDPELRTTTSGQQVLTLGVATNERWKDKATSDVKERTEFHNVVVWGDLAKEVHTHIRKGNRVFVSGRVQTRSWETKDGSKRTTTEVIAETVLLLGVKNVVAQAAVQVDAVDLRSKGRRADDEADAGAAPEDLPAIPEINYASDVKAEDLPF